MEPYTDVPDEQEAFRISFDCKNCGDDFVFGFPAGVRVEPEGARRRNFVGKDPDHGNHYTLYYDGQKYSIVCPTCESRVSIHATERTPA